jgi:hypothetical protein
LSANFSPDGKQIVSASMEMKMKKKWNFKSSRATCKKRCSKCFISSTVTFHFNSIEHKTNQVLRNNFTSYIEVILSHNLNKVIEKWIHNLQFVCTNFCGTYMCTHCSFVEYVQVFIIGRIFESEIILIPPSLKISESSSNGSYRNTDEVWWRYGISQSCDEWPVTVFNAYHWTTIAMFDWSDTVFRRRNVTRRCISNTVLQPRYWGREADSPEVCRLHANHNPLYHRWG